MRIAVTGKQGQVVTALVEKGPQAEAILAGLKARTGKAISVGRITTAEYPTPARRPANSRLDSTRLQQAYGIVLPDGRISTEVALDRLIGTAGGTKA